MIGMAFELMGALANIKTGKAGVSDTLVESVVERVFAHEEKKAGVRPALMKGSNISLFSTGATTLVAAVVHPMLFGGVPLPSETFTQLLTLAGVFAGVSGGGYAVRSVEKHRGKA